MFHDCPGGDINLGIQSLDNFAKNCWDEFTELSLVAHNFVKLYTSSSLLLEDKSLLLCLSNERRGSSALSVKFKAARSFPASRGREGGREGRRRGEVITSWQDGMMSESKGRREKRRRKKTRREGEEKEECGGEARGRTDFLHRVP